jgi:hypothetical protein
LNPVAFEYPTFSAIPELIRKLGVNGYIIASAMASSVNRIVISRRRRQLSQVSAKRLSPDCALWLVQIARMIAKIAQSKNLRNYSLREHHR